MHLKYIYSPLFNVIIFVLCSEHPKKFVIMAIIYCIVYYRILFKIFDILL